jgi:predicted TPR repeat methyltransferase
VVHARAGDLASAERAWTRAVELDATLGDTWFNLALVHRETGDLAAAVSDLRRYIDLASGRERERAIAMLGELERTGGTR